MLFNKWLKWYLFYFVKVNIYIVMNMNKFYIVKNKYYIKYVKYLE